MDCVTREARKREFHDMTTRWQTVLLAAMMTLGHAAWGQTDGVASTGEAQATAESGRKSVVGPPDLKVGTANNAKSGSLQRTVTSVTLLSATQTASPAESFALSGTLAYVCDDNEVSVVDISNPSNLRIVATA